MGLLKWLFGKKTEETITLTPEEKLKKTEELRKKFEKYYK